MIQFPKDIASKILLLFSMVVIALSIRFIHSQNNYSPIDEYAHVDYIEKLSEGHLPKLSDPVSEELFLDVKNNPGRSLNGNITTREELGIGNYSYEAIHPPAYYLTLLPIDLILKKMDIPIFKRVKILRICSYLLFVIGVFLLIPLFNALTLLGYSIPKWYAYLGVFFCLLVVTNHRYGLGNNMMAPLSIDLVAILLLKYLHRSNTKNALLFVAFSCLSIFVAIGNVFILPFLGGIFLYRFLKQFSFVTFFYSSVIVVSFAFLFWKWKAVTVPDATINANFQLILGSFIPAGMVDYKTYLNLLSEDAFRIAFISEKFDITLPLLLFLLLSAIAGLVYIRENWVKYTWAFFFAFLLFCFFVITFLLNRYVARIHWMALRHYLAYLPVFYVSVSFWLLVVKDKLSKFADS